MGNHLYMLAVRATMWLLLDNQDDFNLHNLFSSFKQPNEAASSWIHVNNSLCVKVQLKNDCNDISINEGLYTGLCHSFLSLSVIRATYSLSDLHVSVGWQGFSPSSNVNNTAKSLIMPKSQWSNAVRASSLYITWISDQKIWVGKR